MQHKNEKTHTHTQSPALSQRESTTDYQHMYGKKVNLIIYQTYAN